MPLDVMTSTGPWWVLLPLLGFGLQLKATEQRLETVPTRREIDAKAVKMPQGNTFPV